MLKIKRVYEPAEKSDGKRILVDRLWPRGISKEKAGINLWLKELGPSNELRLWFNHDPAKWTGFKEKYFAELKGKEVLLSQIPRDATLVYSAKDKLHNQAVAIKVYLEKNK